MKNESRLADTLKTFNRAVGISVILSEEQGTEDSWMTEVNN